MFKLVNKRYREGKSKCGIRVRGIVDGGTSGGCRDASGGGARWHVSGQEWTEWTWRTERGAVTPGGGMRPGDVPILYWVSGYGLFAKRCRHVIMRSFLNI